MSPPTEHSTKFGVYVVYCGSDSAFAGRLIEGLKADGRFTVTFDPDTSIDEKDWKGRIGELIEEADAVIVVLSPNSVESCEWEVGHASECSKLIVPLICGQLREAQVPVELSELKRIDFSGGKRFSRSLDALTSLLTSNADWLRDHTRLLVKARAWEEAGYPYHLLLNKHEVVSAKIWALSRPDTAPKPTDVHVTYVCVSEAVETAKQLAEAERQEAEVVALLEASKGGGFLHLTSKMVFVLGYAVVVMALVGSSSYLVAQCKDAISSGPAVFSSLFEHD